MPQRINALGPSKAELRITIRKYKHPAKVNWLNKFTHPYSQIPIKIMQIYFYWNRRDVHARRKVCIV